MRAGWRNGWTAAATAALIGVSIVAAGAQGLPPLPGQPAPPTPFEAKPDCSEKGVKAMEEQLSQLEAIEKAAPETIALVCDGVKSFSDWMGWKDDEPLPGIVNEIARKFLHRDLTPRLMKSMCVQAQGEAMRNFRTEIGQIKDKLTTCKGI